MKKFKVSERQKLIGLNIITGLTLICFILFLFKLPSTSDFQTDQLPKKINSITIKDGDVYEQEIQSKVNEMSIIGILFLREADIKIPGNVCIEVYNHDNKRLSQNCFTANDIPPIQYVNAAFEAEKESKDNHYKIKIFSKGIESNNALKLGIKSTHKFPMIKNGVKQNGELFISQMGKKNDVTYFWYVFMMAAILFPLYGMIDYSSIKGEVHNENK